MLLNFASQATVSCTCHLDALSVINIAAGTSAATLSDVSTCQVLVIVDKVMQHGHVRYVVISVFS